MKGRSLIRLADQESVDCYQLETEHGRQVFRYDRRKGSECANTDREFRGVGGCSRANSISQRRHGAYEAPGDPAGEQLHDPQLKAMGDLDGDLEVDQRVTVREVLGDTRRT